MNLDNLKKQVASALEAAKAKKLEAQKEQTQRDEEQRRNLVIAITSAFEPIFNKISASDQARLQELKDSIAAIRIDAPTITIPPIESPRLPEFPKIPEIKIPPIKVPKPEVTVNIPPVKIPDLKWPSGDMPVTGRITLADINLSNPLPVRVMNLRDFNGGGTVISGSGGGLVTIGGALATVGMVTINPDGSPVYSTAGAGASSVSLINSDGTYYNSDNPLPVVGAVSQVSGANWSVNITNASSAVSLVDSSGIQYSGSNPVPISDAGGSLTIDSANSLLVEQVSGSNWSVLISNASTAVTLIDSSGIGYSGTNPVPTFLASGSNNTVASALVDSSGVEYSGSNPLPTYLALGSNNSLAAAIVDSSGVEYSGSNPLPITGTVTVGSITNTVTTSLTGTDGSYTAANPFPITLVSGALTSTIVTGSTLQGVADDGSAPQKDGGIAMQTNPTAVSDGNRVSARLDDIGRFVVQPYQVRDLIATARVSLATGAAFGTETTLITGVAGVFNDLMSITATNDSTAAVSIDIRDGTAAGIALTLVIPTANTITRDFNVPMPQGVAAQSWTVDAPDITGTNVTVSAVYIKNV